MFYIRYEYNGHWFTHAFNFESQDKAGKYAQRMLAQGIATGAHIDYHP